MRLRFSLKHIVLFFLFAFTQINAQIFEPVKWTSRIEKVSNTEFNLIMEGTIDDGWHVYSQFSHPDGSMPAVVKFIDANGNYTLMGKTSEGKTEKQYSDVFEVDETFFSHKALFKQKVKITNPAFKKIKATLAYQVCKDRCINDDEVFFFDIPKIPAAAITPVNTNETAVTPTVDSLDSAPVVNDTVKKTTVGEAAKTEIPKKKEAPQSLWLIFIGTIVAGVFVTFTPCVFPMIPMTVSFFLKQSGSRSKGKFNAFFYGFCIIAIYVLISLPFHLFEQLNTNMFTEISTNIYLNLFFFVIFVVFAISFFGAFEITMPNWLASKADNASNSGGLLGIFFMALTLIIVSFSCTGPALGAILGSVLSTDGGATILTVAMLGFGLGLAMPFISLALFPSLIKNMPKSGGWLNTVKVVFGFIELALAFKFLSSADLVLETHILDREVFLAIWIAIFALLSMYLFGKISLPHDDNSTHISVGRMLLGLLTLSFTIYMIPGLWGAPLKLISAFPPPQVYSESPDGFGSNTTAALPVLPEGAIFGPHHIVSFEDYDEGLAYARKVGKPVMIDFTGKTCTNCRLTENNVWSDPKVLSILKNDVVLISLYGDSAKELPKSEQYVSKATGSEITTVGQKWSDFEREKYKSNSRPYYVLMGLDEQNLNEPIAYEPNVGAYYKWLVDGVSKFKK